MHELPSPRHRFIHRIRHHSAHTRGRPSVLPQECARPWQTQRQRLGTLEGIGITRRFGGLTALRRALVLSGSERELPWLLEWARDGFGRLGALRPVAPVCGSETPQGYRDSDPLLEGCACTLHGSSRQLRSSARSFPVLRKPTVAKTTESYLMTTVPSLLRNFPATTAPTISSMPAQT